MSSRWPQGQQDQRSPFATYDEDWPQDGDGAQSWQDAGWQDTGWPDPNADPGQWASAEGTPGPGTPAAEPWASAPGRPQAAPRSGDLADPYQQEWNQSAGGSGDDADLEWFQYLSQGRSAPAKPDPAPAAPSRDSKPGQRGWRQRDRDKPSRRGGARSERSARPDRSERSGRPDRSERSGRPDRFRSRRDHDRPALADPGLGPDAPAGPEPGWDSPGDPGFGRPAAAASPAADLGYTEPATGGRHALAGREYELPGADPEPDRPAAGRHGLTDPGYGWGETPDAARHASSEPAGWAGEPDAPGLARPAAAGWAAVPDPAGYAAPEVAGWADEPDAPRHALSEPASWAGMPDAARHAPSEPTDWREGPDASGYAPSEAPGWPEAPDARRHVSSEPPSWAGVPDAPRHSSSEPTSWAEAPDAPTQASSEPAAWAGVPDAARHMSAEPASWRDAPDVSQHAPSEPAWAGVPDAVRHVSAEPASWREAPDVSQHAPSESAGWARRPDTSGLAPSQAAGWAAVADTPAYGSPEVAGWADGPDASPYAAPETPDWPDTPNAPGAASPEVGDWAAAPVASGYAPLEAPDWSEVSDQPDSVGWPAEADPGYSPDAPTDLAFGIAASVRLDPDSGRGSGPGYQPTGARHGDRAGDSRGPRRAPAKRTRSKQARGRKPVNAPSGRQSAPSQDVPRPQGRPAPRRQPVGHPPRTKSARKTRGRLSWPILALAAASAIAVGAVVSVLSNNSGGGAAHVLTTPTSLGVYVKQPQLAEQMHAATLRQQILQQSAGEANNVIYAVYEDSTGPAASSGPQIFLFIGGNLKGTSAGPFISTFTGKVPDAQTTSAGTLGGAAACFPSVNGRLAGCVWADNDTFGLVASQTLSSTGLANEMRQMRPMVEHQASSAQ
jgi:hypothetical protein